MTSIPTPDYSHLKCYDSVYEPSEDSFLFLDALEQEQDFLKQMNPLICVEVGSGSGIILTFLASILGRKSHYIGIDVNEEASKCTQQSLRHHSIQNYDCICDNMFDSLSPRMRGTVDVVLFNPPYVPTPSDEVGGTGLSASWAGGIHGREVIDLLLPQVDSFLSDDGGVFYLLTVEENRPEEICHLMIAKGLIASKVLTRRARNELLTVLKFVKKPSKNDLK